MSMRVADTHELAKSVDGSDPADWRLVGEGGANIVVAYHGAHLPQLHAKCLRLRKYGRSGHPPADDVDGAVAFHDRVVEPLLGRDLTAPMIPLLLSPAFISRLKDALITQRDAARRERGDIDDQSCLAVITENLVGPDSDTLAFEIKPKWAWLPSAESELDPSTSALKRSFCRTCMLRAVRHGMRGRARFCPLMLFSHRRELVCRAIGALLALWKSPEGAGNNFRVFSGGAPATPAEGLHVSQDDVDSLADALASSAALKRLAELQRRFDPLDIETVERLLASDPSLAEPPVSLDELTRFITSSSPPLPTAGRALAAAYLLSATFKDCSLLIRARGSPLQVESVKVVDCDVKGVDRLTKFIATDRMLRQRFGELAEGMVPCLDLQQEH